jgi:hypothetical protein
MENDNSKKDFFRYVFYLEEDAKFELMNTVQFSIMALVPVIIFSKLLDKYVPKPDETKSNIEISAELLIQILVLVFGVFFSIRMVTFFPTYSGVEYGKINELGVMLSIIFIVLMLDDLLVDKINFMSERLHNLWEGKPDKKHISKASKVTVKPGEGHLTSNKYSSHNDNNTTQINQLPVMESQVNSQALSQQMPNFNNMYRQDTNSNSAPSSMDDLHTEPIAANSAFGGFSNW